jgi:hypothetical protein
MSEAGKIQPLNPGDMAQRIAALERQNAELTATVAALRAELERLKRRQQRQAAPFSKETRVAAPKRPGRKPGEGVFRHRAAPAPELGNEPPIEVPVGLTACPRCGGALVEERVDFASVTDLPAQPRAMVRHYRVSVCRCQACGRAVRGRHLDLAPDQLGATAHRVGPRLLAAGQALHYGYGVPLRRVPAILGELTGARVTQGALVHDALRRASTGGAIDQSYQDLRKAIPEAASIHTDDSGWSVHGTPAYLMVFETETATVYQIRPQHRNEEVREVVPAHYAGVLVTDRGRSYDARELAEVKQQKCLAHLQRSISAVLETKWGRGRSLGLGLRAIFAEALGVWQDVHAGAVSDTSVEAAALGTRLSEALRPRTLPDPDNQRLLNELGWHHARGNLLRFLADPRIEPTNNRAERALRPAVIARKVSQCSKNQRGADAFAAFTSVTRTAARSGGSVIDDLEQRFRSPPPSTDLPPLPHGR